LINVCGGSQFIKLISTWRLLSCNTSRQPMQAVSGQGQRPCQAAASLLIKLPSSVAVSGSPRP
jgi:hypothetical protein